VYPTRLLLRICRLALLLTGVFVMVFGVIRMQPNNNADILALLMPPQGCPAPCFLGVRPGRTTSAEAVAVLEQHEWIAAVEPSADFLDLRWSGTQPGFLDSDARNYLHVAWYAIGEIRLATTLSLGDLWVALGQPEAGFAVPTASGSGFNQHLIYRQLGVEVGSFVRCSAQRQDLWHVPVEIRLHNRLLDYSDSTLDLVELWRMPCS
jgi:hypothetical protein